jgi:adenylate cyclase
MVNRLRLYSGLVLLVFVVGHLANHSLGLISIETMNAGLPYTIEPWRTVPGTILLAAASAVHVAVAFWSLYRRRNLRLRLWEAAQLVLGFLIVPLLAAHFLATRGLHEVSDLKGDYALELAALWVIYPEHGVLNGVGLAVVWAHACVGLHAWLRLKRWYAAVQQFAFAFALLLPTLALSGYVSSGVRALDLARDPVWIERLAQTSGFRPEMADGFVFPWERVAVGSLIGLLVLVFAAREIRSVLATRRAVGKLRYRAAGRGLDRTLELERGATVLEVIRAAGIPHASVCGGRGRCSTCRVHVGAGIEFLPPPEPTERRVLERISAPLGVRLACQVRPTRSLEVTPLLPAAATARDGFQGAAALQGVEREVAVLFVDMRDYTRLSEGRLPFDVVFVLNRYFAAMGEAVQQCGGRLDKFIGDGVMALFGVDSDGEDGCRRALAAARLMSEKLVELNASLADDLRDPLRIGVGIHVGPVIVGEMGHGPARGVTAIGDVVNIASRLEGMTKEFGVQLVVSEDVAVRSRVDLEAFDRRAVDVRGRAAVLNVRLVASALALPAR